MQQALAISNETRRLSIHADAACIDVVLSAVVRVELLIPAIVDALADRGEVAIVAASYRLSTMGGVVLNASKTLIALGIRDGTTLMLVQSAMEFTAPGFDDTAEAVAATIAATSRRWTRRTAQLVGMLAAGCMASVGATLLLRTEFGAGEVHRTGCVVTAGTISFIALLAAIAGYRVFGERAAGLSLGLASTAFAALAGLFAVPGGPGAPNALFAAAAATTTAAILRAIACHTVTFTALACFSAICVAAALAAVMTGAPLPAVGAGLAAISLALVEASPPMSIALARLSEHLPAGSARDPDQLHRNAIRAHTWITSLIVAFAASAALGAVGAVIGLSGSGATRLPATILGIVTGTVLLLRSRAHQDIGRSIPLIITGTVTLSAVLVAYVVAYPHRALHVVALSTLLGAGSLYLGIVGGAASGSPAARRTVELMEYLAFATVVPLAFWLCGLYGTVRSVNLS